MKKYLVFLLISLVPLSAGATERGIVPVAIKDKSGKQIGLYKESHALVIGASEYANGWPRLPGVMEDIREVKSVLESRGFNVVVVQNPNRDQLDKAFNSFINKYGNEKDNRLLFYFAGHGHTLKPAYGGEMGYIVPVDAPNPDRDETGFREKAMDMQMVEVYARRIQSKHAVFIFDSCFSGSVFAMSRAIPQSIQVKTSLPVRQFITAGTAEQTVPDKSIFRGQFVRALQGDADLNHDGYITASELGQYLEDTVTNYSRRSQTPQYGKIRDPNLDQGDFVFPLQTAISPAGIKVEEKKVEEESAMAEPSVPPKPFANAPAGMVSIPGGEFTAGLDPNIALAECQKYYKNCKNGAWAMNASTQQVSVNSFFIDKFEITQAEYERVMGSNPSKFRGGNLPVERVTWVEADTYCKRVGKRLPTELEWEKAAKGGRDTIYAWGDDGDMADTYAWYNKNSGGRTHPVGEKIPNGYGLYDMAGNVWEWTSSFYDKSGKHKVLRGGSWYADPNATRPAYRGTGVPGARDGDIGFRCAK